MQHPDPKGTGGRGKFAELLAGNCSLLSSAPLKINRPSNAILEKPRSPFPIYWRPGRGALGLTFVGTGGEI